MEQVRLLIAIALSFLVFLLWEVFAPKQPVQKPEKEKTQQSEQLAKQEPYIKEAEPVTDMIGPPEAQDAFTPYTEPVREARVITVTSPFYSVKISEKGAVFKSFVLKDYKEKVDKDSPFKEMIPESLQPGNILTKFAGNSLPGLETAVFSADSEAESVSVETRNKIISFSWESPQGIVFEKSFHFSPSTYIIGLAVTIKNGSEQTIHDNLTVSLLNPVPQNKQMYGFEGPSALIRNSLEQIKIDDIEEKNKYDGELKWIALENRYFMSAVIPVKPAESSMHLFVKDKILESRYMNPVSDIRPGTQQRFEFDLFLGPKSLKILNEINNGLEKAINFGWFDFIAKPCLWLMNFLHSFIPNYGLAIIILTILLKLILWPLGNISYKSMNEMKKLQPLMADIREKYKGDKKRMNQELMGLYQTYKINPMSGCLPMVAQIPVFFALYRMLYEAIELRHAPFMGWINDLSAPDRLFNFSFSIPFMDPPYGIPVLTIIMGATMLLQQKMSPPPGDPAQAKMMMFMPIVFTFIFINFSSGLVLYWLVNNILSISQQYYVSKKKAQ
ncbi:membrane protein insertase YidC [Desulfonema magnum]|uniref:Membrane protein insertase YidC n=1 Tax=Desulfonema magnum TaxID=45655 RepID=A0A975GT90_9BACT|nr:membrane protein insertase YidC [Desulfonema magnum]QTA92742.1 Putative membrane protein insertase, YidC-like [Desulfonema magnum]